MSNKIEKAKEELRLAEIDAKIARIRSEEAQVDQKIAELYRFKAEYRLMLTELSEEIKSSKPYTINDQDSEEYDNSDDASLMGEPYVELDLPKTKSELNKGVTITDKAFLKKQNEDSIPENLKTAIGPKAKDKDYWNNQLALVKKLRAFKQLNNEAYEWGAGSSFNYSGNLFVIAQAISSIASGYTTASDMYDNGSYDYEEFRAQWRNKVLEKSTQLDDIKNKYLHPEIKRQVEVSLSYFNELKTPDITENLWDIVKNSDVLEDYVQTFSKYNG